MNCPHSDNELIDEDATICPKCGKSLTLEDEPHKENSEIIQQKRTDMVIVAAILTIIPATFMASIGYIGVYQYQALVEYYGSEVVSEVIGFLIFGVVDIICAAFALVGGVLMLKRKHLIISILGVVVLLFSVVSTYIIITQYNFAFTDVLLFAEISAFILSVISGLLIITSKAEFTG